MLKREGNGQNQNKQPAEVGGPSPGMAIAQGEGLSKHMRKRVRVGRTGGKGALVTGRGICLQRRVGSLVFNAVLAPGPVNRPAFPFSCGAKGESQRWTRPSQCQDPGQLIFQRIELKSSVTVRYEESHTK